MSTGGTYSLANVSVTANFSDSTNAVVTNVTWSGTSVSGMTFTAPISTGSVTLTCSYSENNVTKTTSFVVTVTGAAPSRRFVKDVNGIVTDSQTGLQWLEADTRIYPTSWYYTASWTASLSVGGGGWRMPTMAELRLLSTDEGAFSGMAVWSAEIVTADDPATANDESTARVFYFGFEGVDSRYEVGRLYYPHPIAVR